MNVDYKLAGKRIQAARKQSGMTQETLAEKLDVSIGYVSQVERGVTKISLDLLAAIANALGCDLSVFVTGASAGTGYLEAEFGEMFRSLDIRERKLTLGFIRLLIQNRT